MRASKEEIRRVVRDARKYVPGMSSDLRNTDIWFEKAEAHAQSNERKQALWSLCVLSCLLFEDELRNKKKRNDIISQIHHQFQAYGRPVTSN